MPIGSWGHLEIENYRNRILGTNYKHVEIPTPFVAHGSKNIVLKLNMVHLLPTAMLHEEGH